jgi:hypothetical protein
MVLWRQLLPNLWAPIIVVGTLLVPERIAAEAALSFLGAGIPPPRPSWARPIGSAVDWISTDSAVIQRVAHRVAVMHRGHVVELGPTDAVLREPLHPYTTRLLAAAPVADPVEQRRRRDVWRNLVEPAETGVPDSGTKIG